MGQRLEPREAMVPTETGRVEAGLAKYEAAPTKASRFSRGGGSLATRTLKSKE